MFDKQNKIDSNNKSRGNKTQAYSTNANRTRRYGNNTEAAGKTTGYDSHGFAKVDKTDTHGLGVGDEIQLNEKQYKIIEIISGDDITGEAVIYKIKDDEKKEFVLKLYYRFSNPKDEPNHVALQRIKNIIDPDVLNLHDFGTGDNKFLNKYCFEISDVAKGSDLLSVQEIKQKYTIEFLRSKVIPQIFKGIRTLHDHKIFHCDLKPQNVFYLDSNQTDLVIGDYGSAKTFEESSEKTSHRTSPPKGTDLYLAPEQARGIISEKNDYHSFGMILLHLLYPEFVNQRDLSDQIIERQFARKPIIDFNSEFEKINNLIAGLTLVESSSRWGENAVKAWLRGDDVEIKYSGEEVSHVQPINLGSAIIKTEDGLINYIENNTEWYEDLGLVLTSATLVETGI